MHYLALYHWFRWGFHPLSISRAIKCLSHVCKRQSCIISYTQANYLQLTSCQECNESLALILWFTWCSPGRRLRSGLTLTWHRSDTPHRPASLSPDERSTVWVYMLHWPVWPAGTHSNCDERQRKRENDSNSDWQKYMAQEVQSHIFGSKTCRCHPVGTKPLIQLRSQELSNAC